MVRKLSFLLVLCVGVSLAIAAEGPAPEDFSLKLELVPDTTDQVLVVGSWTVDHVQGWSWGVCHNPDEASIGDCAGQVQPPNPCEGGCANIECPDDMKAPGPQGQAASFHSLNIYENGVTQGIVLDFMQTWDLMAKDRFEMLKIKYDLKGDSADLSFCSTLGTPPVDTTYVVNGASIPPATQEGIKIGSGGPPPACEALKMKLAKEGDDKVAVLLDTTTDQEVSGFQFGIKVDSADLNVLNIEPGSAFTDMSFDVKTEGFWGLNILEGQGATLGVVIDLEPSGDPPAFVTLPAEKCDQQIALVSFQCSQAAGDSVTANVSLAGDLGNPPVEIVVDVDGTSLEPAVGDPVSVTVACAGVPTAPFIRGDVTQDGRYTVSDGVAIAKAVFGQGAKLELIQKCMDSADADDDGDVDTQDAIYLLSYLFTGGAAVPAPVGTCGQDPTDDELTCDEYQCPQQ